MSDQQAPRGRLGGPGPADSIGEAVEAERWQDQPEPCDTASPTMELVQEFHRAFGLPIAARVGPPAADLVQLRKALLFEEFQEYLTASARGDLVEIADALADMVYVIYGTALTYGIDLDAVLAEVHRSNMSKLADDGRPILRADGKVLKGDRYSQPDIASALACPPSDPSAAAGVVDPSAGSGHWCEVAEVQPNG